MRALCAATSQALTAVLCASAASAPLWVSGDLTVTRKRTRFAGWKIASSQRSLTTFAGDFSTR